jgi:hypothetical protein
MFRVLPSGLMVIILLFISPLRGISQTNQTSTPEIKEQARKDFDAGHYGDAFRNYATLLNRYPKDGLFNYYAGICLLKENENIPGSIQYLDFASSKSMVPADVFYYLGMAYRKNYQFSESSSAFNKFAEAAGRSESKELVPAREAQMSGNAMSLTQEYNPFEIYQSSLFSFSDTNYVREIKGKGGRLGIKPEELFSKNETPEDLTAFCFMPKNLAQGDYIYFSGFGRSKKNGSDLFRVKRNIRNQWGEPQAISSLNTGFDEIMPYYDPVSNDLYFASRGYSSMGGFDVFKSHYDPERDEWSQPISLGFPVNSPDNEYLVMPGPDLGTLLLITDRQGLDSMLTVYILQMMEPKKSLAGASQEEIRRIGKLGGIESITSIIDLRNEPVQVKTVAKEKVQADVKTTGKANLDMPDGYQGRVRQALNYQVTADSLTRLAREARIRVKEMPDPNERWAWQSKIIGWEKEASDYQDKADVLYAEVKQMENGKKENAVPQAIKKDTVINGITRYTYREPEKNVETTKKTLTRQAAPTVETFKTKDEPGDMVKIPPKDGDNFNRFVILGKSPYNAKNPFPVNTAIPKGPFYRIQLGVFGSAIDYNTFGGISPITAETVPGKSLTRYYGGKFTRYEDARIAAEKVKQSGFGDAFIVGWYDGQKLPVSRVLELEKRDTAR